MLENGFLYPLFILKENMNDIIKVMKSLDLSGVLSY